MAISTVAPSGATMNKKLGFSAMLLSATGMGLVGTFGRLATPIDPATGAKYITGDFLAFGRMTVGVLGMLAIILAVKKLSELRRTKLSFSVVAGGLAIGASLAFYVSSTLMTTIANAVFLIYTGPLFSAILAWIFLKEKINLRNASFLLLVFVGMLMTIGLINYSAGNGLTFGLELGANPDMPNKTMGDIFGLASGLFYGLALFFYRYRPDIASEIRSFWNFVFGAVGAVAVMIFRLTTLDPTNPLEVMTGTHWAWGGAMFVVCGLLAIGLLPVAGKHLMAVELSCVSYWECVVGIVLGVLVWHESMTLIGAIGGVLIIVGGMAPMLVQLIRRPREALEIQVPESTLTKV
ncbi:DMT family transporter [Georgenia yuyongxinii]|uniref:EamA family transporter n=1 Tax=Georgenia yuyongxinii TaxID=2589797 RepID=A0A552WS42_9MICO|nr:DMT family transporter [Georgenia yuyongxinii]TRW45223.1 EamA family transporter [Georgenia yuyongxinii]